MLPGFNDPASTVRYSYSYYHDYTLSIPSILFGIPYPSNHEIEEYQGKVFYTLGRGSDIQLIYNSYNELALDLFHSRKVHTAVAVRPKE